ncbi:U3 snoRNA associated-domain-containing protein [Clohesyomyces aquaticus]|uniref:U3 snoRNA associated-domain-containing protein n=1 Tax=Clohesyomyces aquaticus TaxID=1231657 RepID=A0A1Y1ZY69_9PLEO|nr:U3 snoRNA associated-domain-containing protein [Clohesyomyces aquaticus]
MVTAASARSTTQAAMADAVRARKAQEEKEKLKRKERAERIAQEQEEKKKREEKKAKNLAKIEAKQKPVEEQAPLLDIRNLPALLPESFLEAAGDARPPTPPPVKAGKSEKELHKEKLNRHIKFLEQSEKPIKDVKKGPVNVRVLAQQNMLLAPKVNRGTRNIREHWLKGRHQEKRDKNGRRKMELHKLERRAPGRGFLRGEEE